MFNFCDNPSIENDVVDLNDGLDFRNALDFRSTSGGRNPLIQMIAEGEWEKAEKAVQDLDNVDIVRKWTATPSIGGSVYESRILPIHQACTKSDVPLAFIKALVNAYPHSLGKTEVSGKRTPLHLAAVSYVSEDVLLYLIDKYPYPCTMKDAFGRVPLHYACSNNASITVIKKLISICPKSIGVTDDGYWTPFHVSSNMAFSVEVVDAMLREYPKAIAMVTDQGSSPLTLARNNQSQARDLIVTRLVEE